jgi:hypothetical protein
MLLGMVNSRSSGVVPEHTRLSEHSVELKQSAHTGSIRICRVKVSGTYVVSCNPFAGADKSKEHYVCCSTQVRHIAYRSSDAACMRHVCAVHLQS